MTYQAVKEFDKAKLPLMMLDRIPAGVTVINPEGTILYYNEYSTQILDRKPEYLGKDIRQCHKNPESIEKIDRMLEKFNDGRKKAFQYEIIRDGRRLKVNNTPFLIDGRLFGCIQTVYPI
jgi:DUF438 domain-containing protein